MGNNNSYHHQEQLDQLVASILSLETQESERKQMLRRKYENKMKEYQDYQKESLKQIQIRQKQLNEMEENILRIRIEQERQLALEQQISTAKKIRVIFLGATGNGKSTLCNDLLGINHFKAQANVGGGGISSIFQEKNTWRGGKELCVIDSPGLGDATIDITTAIDTLYKSVGGAGQISAIILVVKASDQRFETASRITMNFAQSFIGEIDSKRFWLAITWAQMFDDHTEATNFAKAKKAGIKNEFNIDIPEENTIFAYKNKTTWVDNFIEKITAGRAGILRDPEQAFEEFDKEIADERKTLELMKEIFDQNELLLYQYQNLQQEL